MLSVGGENSRPDWCIQRHCLETFSRVKVPELDLRVEWSRNEHLFIVWDREWCNPIRVTSHSDFSLHRLYICQVDVNIFSRWKESLTILRELESSYWSLMIPKWLLDFVILFDIIYVDYSINLPICTEKSILWVSYRRCELLTLTELSYHISLSDVKNFEGLTAS